jgi:sugar phosphate isomerase/epimerase
MPVPPAQKGPDRGTSFQFVPGARITVLSQAGDWSGVASGDAARDPKATPMDNPLSLAFLTLPLVPVPEVIRIAADTGFTGVGLRLLPGTPEEPPYPLLDDAAALREVRAALEATGVRVTDVEIVRLKPATEVAGFRPFLDRAAALGARHVLVAGDDPDRARLTERFAAFAVLAAEHDLTADLEFMPWTQVPDLATARAIVAAAGAPNGGVLVDALHFDRSASTQAEVAALPPGLVHYVQLCDGPAAYDRSPEGLALLARTARLMPGEGAIDLVGLARAFPPGVTVSVEVPNLMRDRTMGAREVAARAHAAARAVLRAAGRVEAAS